MSPFPGQLTTTVEYGLLNPTKRGKNFGNVQIKSNSRKRTKIREV